MKLLQGEQIMGVSLTWLPWDSYGFLIPRCSPHKISVVIISKACNNTQADVAFFTSIRCPCFEWSRQNICKQMPCGWTVLNAAGFQGVYFCHYYIIAYWVNDCHNYISVMEDRMNCRCNGNHIYIVLHTCKYVSYISNLLDPYLLIHKLRTNRSHTNQSFLSECM
jgi:hypothetical protein